jgi:hypothetical protein
MALKLINLFAFALMIMMNYLANAIPLGGKTTGELSAQYPNLFVPAGITFSIWGVIYILLLGFCILQFVPRNRVMVDALGLLFAISCVLNALWIVAWHYEKPGLSMIIMLLLLATLVMVNQRLTIFAPGITKSAFGMYLGWICIATIANATAFLVAVNWQGWGLTGEFWASVMILAGAAISMLVLTRFWNPFTGLAVMWALAGIIIARSWPDHRSVIIVAVVSFIAVTVLTALIALRRYNPA